MPPRDFCRHLRRDTARIRLCRELDSHVRQEQAQNGDKIDAAESAKNNHVINSLYAGWGARTRTWEWRNQKSLEQSDLPKLFSRLMVKACMSHQMVMSNFPTGRMVGKVCRWKRGTVRPCGDHDLGEPSRARRRWA